PISPHEQPILAQLTVTNGDAEAQKVKIQVELKWNNKVLIQPGKAVFITIQPIPAGESIYLNNRHLISESGSAELDTDGNINIDIIGVMERSPSLKDAILSGYFPDGELQMKASVKAENSPMWDNVAVLTIKIRNAGGIYPISPGKAIGTLPPKVKEIPVSFLWNAINTGFKENTQHIVIKEFPPNNPPNISTVAHTGVDVYRTREKGESSGFSEYIPFTNKHYYAWRVYTPIYDQLDFITVDKTSSGGNFLASEWFVFQYLPDDIDAPDSSDVMAMLQLLGNPYLINFLNMGLTPTGEVIFEGRRYTGQDAIDILSSLAGKEIQVELKD
ncbi:MAG: hypothetical protein PHR27_09745, partial [Candidatus Cloacimonetes bacterium]|nr:hypothetical protein [Candidatus Cloacimonadota bacterium]